MIVLVDYKAGNMASVAKAFEHLGKKVCVTESPEVAAKASKLVLPGVGHFAATEKLTRSGMRDAIAETIARGAPFLGICVGMQWLYQGSEEAPGSPGLGAFSGVCEKFSDSVKSPHVGWNRIRVVNGSRLLRGVEDGSFVYFTHSYRVSATGDASALTSYGGEFACAVERDNIFGVQFHPEKSGAAGLALLRNFVELAC